MNVFFIGHRDAPQTIYPKIQKTVEHLILQNGADSFFVGEYGQFDSMVSRALSELKKQYPTICVYRLIAYYSAEHPPLLPEGFNGSFFPSDLETVPHHAAIVRANRYMVDHADILVAYVRYTASNSRALLEYAQKREKRGLLTIKMIDP